MSNQVTPASYVGSLPQTTLQLQGPSAWSGFIHDLEAAINPSSPSSAASQVDSFFASFNSHTNPLPTSYSAFITAFKHFAGITTTPSTTGSVDNFKNWIGANAASNDWSLIQPSPDFTSMFESWFSHFLSSYTYLSTGAAGTTSQFLSQMSQSLTITSRIMDQTTNDPNLSVFSSQPAGATLPLSPMDPNLQPGAAFPSLPNYQAVFNILFPDGTVNGQSFATVLNQFVAQQISNNQSSSTDYGFFIPSYSFSAWTNQMLSDAASTVNASALQVSSLSGGDFSKPLILNRIFGLLTDMINTLQNIAAAQAAHLVILTNWQQSYTNSVSQLHTFLMGNQDYLGANASDSTSLAAAKAGARAEVNDQQNSNLRNLMEAQSSIVSDNAKSMQSNINQSNDAVSQQANVGSTIIQELNTLLSAVIVPQ